MRRASDRDRLAFRNSITNMNFMRLRWQHGLAAYARSVRPHVMWYTLVPRSFLVATVLVCLAISSLGGQQGGEGFRFRKGFEILFLRLDGGPLGSPPAGNVGVGFRGSVEPHKFNGHTAFEFQASFLAGGDVPAISSLDATVLIDLPPYAPDGDDTNGFVSLGAGVAYFASLGGFHTLEAYCDFTTGECVGRGRYRFGFRGWVTAGSGLDTGWSGLAPGRIHAQLMVPVPWFSEERQRWYIRLGLGWYVGE